MMNGLQSVTHWQNYFGTPKGATLGFFNAAYPLGGIGGVFLISPIADAFGRRIGLAAGAALCCIGAALQGGSINIMLPVRALVTPSDRS
jgi:MFS family permease